jgi:hypothetical protein
MKANVTNKLIKGLIETSPIKSPLLNKCSVIKQSNSLVITLGCKRLEMDHL